MCWRIHAPLDSCQKSSHFPWTPSHSSSMPISTNNAKGSSQALYWCFYRSTLTRDEARSRMAPFPSWPWNWGRSGHFNQDSVYPRLRTFTDTFVSFRPLSMMSTGIDDSGRNCQRRAPDVQIPELPQQETNPEFMSKLQPRMRIFTDTLVLLSPLSIVFCRMNALQLAIRSTSIYSELPRMSIFTDTLELLIPLSIVFNSPLEKIIL